MQQVCLGCMLAWHEKFAWHVGAREIVCPSCREISWAVPGAGMGDEHCIWPLPVPLPHHCWGPLATLHLVLSFAVVSKVASGLALQLQF